MHVVQLTSFCMDRTELSTAGFVSQLTSLVGATVANAFCVGVHFATFSIKVALVVWLLVRLRRALPRLAYAQSLALCWKGLVPLALANLLGTGVWLLAPRLRPAAPRSGAAAAPSPRDPRRAPAQTRCQCSWSR